MQVEETVLFAAMAKLPGHSANDYQSKLEQVADVSSNQMRSNLSLIDLTNLCVILYR